MPMKTFQDTWPRCPRGSCDQGRSCDCVPAEACAEIGCDCDEPFGVFRGLRNALLITGAVALFIALACRLSGVLLNH